MEILVRIVAPHFVAGLILRDGKVIRAAPILKWTVGKQQKWLSQYFKSKGWKATIIK